MDSRNYAFKAFGDGDHIYASVYWPKQRKDAPYGIGK